MTSDYVESLGHALNNVLILKKFASKFSKRKNLGKHHGAQLAKKFFILTRLICVLLFNFNKLTWL